MSVSTELDTINIRDLVIQDPEIKPSVTFDPEREISFADWNHLKKMAMDQKRSGWTAFGEMAFDLVLLFPERRKELINEESDWQSFKERVNQIKGKRLSLALYSELARARILFPDKWDEMSMEAIALREHVSKKMQEYWPGSSQYSSVLVEIKLLDSELFEQVRPSERSWDGMGGFLEECKDPTSQKRFSTQAAEMRVIDPDLFQTMVIDQDTWQGLLDKLENCRVRGNWIGFAQRAKELAILSAQEIQFTNDGIKITYPSTPLFSDSISLPETRSF